MFRGQVSKSLLIGEGCGWDQVSKGREDSRLDSVNRYTALAGALSQTQLTLTLDAV